MPGYFTNSKTEQEIERLMRNKPEKAESSVKQSRQEMVVIKRCQNCSAYDKEDARCTLRSCMFAYLMRKEPTCDGCPYRNGICNICYRNIK